MSKDENDRATSDIFGGVDPGAAAVVERAKAEALEDLHLASEHNLVRVDAYIKDETKAEKLTKNAERQKRFAEKQKASGLAKAFIPAEVAEAIKTVEGGFPAWLEQQRAAAVASVQPEQAPQAAAAPAQPAAAPAAPAPAQLTAEQERLIAVGRSVERLTGWRRWLVYSLLGH